MRTKLPSMWMVWMHARAEGDNNAFEAESQFLLVWIVKEVRLRTVFAFVLAGACPNGIYITSAAFALKAALESP